MTPGQYRAQHDSTPSIQQVQAFWAAAENGVAADIVSFLDKHIGAINAGDAGGNTALMLAARANNKDIIILLLDAGAAYAAKALRLAAFYGCTDSVAVLLERGTDPEQTDPSGNTALMDAASMGRKDTVIFLLGKGARFEAVDKRGRTAQMIAKGLNHNEVADVLAQWEAQKLQSQQEANKDQIKNMTDARLEKLKKMQPQKLRFKK